MDDKAAALSRTEKALDFYQATSAPAAAAPKVAMKVPDPTSFSKGRAENRIFRAKLRAKLSADGHALRDETHRLANAMGFLAGEAYEIAHPLHESGAIVTIEALLSHLDANYEDLDRKRTAQRSLRSLRQDSKDFSAHYAKVQSLVSVLGWNEEAIQAALCESLSSDLKDTLSYAIPAPNKTYSDYVAKIKVLGEQRCCYSMDIKATGGKAPQSTPKRPGPAGRNQSNDPKDPAGATPHTGSAPPPVSRSPPAPSTADTQMSHRTHGAL